MDTAPRDNANGKAPEVVAPESEISDAEVARRTLGGDPSAFEVVVRRYHRDLLRLIRGITHNLEEAEDLTQDAFLRAYRHLDRYDQARPFRPWLWTIGIRLALHAIARKGRKNVSLDREVPELAGGGRQDGPWFADERSNDDLAERLLRRDLMKALEVMEPQYSAVLILRVLEERSYEEMSEILGIPKGTVMSRLFRARQQLKEKLRDFRPEGKSDDRAV
jgi:RNA polymerase sigma-70 factor (ECF subfamily)